ncbi:hypothetical protein Q3A66_08810 [Hymenobacter sp. BT770]|uniref:hypothetical protein n=1 Tax=Hymenobacter sp. BT770 TaxID=2886942 RepID=UPI001D1158D2|nr:hypothetical protein [Hymenobacter sp. BT770]MCC3152152.1 hypothetical protein [Hymenobacter sp. BT770]MDO3415166.1 hypothetical protein [Hymenobacter sp. BT770]
MEFSLFALIKFGQKVHIQELLDKGVLYMNHVIEFVKIEDAALRGDVDEALISIEDVFNMDVLLDGVVIAKAAKGCIAVHNNYPVGNIYSMYGLYKTEDLSQISVDARCKKFGDSCLIIHNVGEFLKRVENAALVENKKVLYSPVTYEDKSSYRGKWSLFKKPVLYSYQSEFRLLVKQSDFIGPIILTLGPLNDIALMFDSNAIDNLKVEDRLREV